MAASQLSMKISKIQRVAYINKLKRDRQIVILQQILESKRKCEEELKRGQNRYLTSIDHLNYARRQSQISMLQSIEGGMDHLRQQLYELFERCKDHEKLENQARQELSVADRKLKITEKLLEKYQDQLRQNLAKREQDTIDEITSRTFGDSP